MSKVYVVQEVVGKNITPAKRYGQFVFIFPSHQVPIQSGEFVKKAADAMVDFTKDDFLLAIGDPVAIGIACAIAAQYTGGDFQMLKWDKQDHEYNIWRIQT